MVESGGRTVVRFAAGCCLPERGACSVACPCAAGASREVPFDRLSPDGDFRDAGTVVLSVPARALRRVAAVVFGAPLAALLAGGWLGTALARRAALDPDAVGALVALAGLGLVVAMVVGRGRMLTHMLSVNVTPRGMDR